MLGLCASFQLGGEATQWHRLVCCTKQYTRSWFKNRGCHFRGGCWRSSRRLARWRQASHINHFIWRDFVENAVEAAAAGPLLSDEGNGERSRKLRFTRLKIV